MLSFTRCSFSLAVKYNIWFKLTSSVEIMRFQSLVNVSQVSVNILNHHGFARSISFTSCALGRRDKIHDALMDREYEKAKAKLKAEDDEPPDPRSVIQIMERAQRRRERAMKKARAARLFHQPKEERLLTRDTMDQIRYLKQEHPEEWTIQRLAYSFNVSEDIIIKVLKSKFVPSERARQKQDLKVKINLGLLPIGTTVEDEGDSQNLEKSIDAPSTRLLTGDKQHSQNLLSDKQTSHSKLFSHTVHKSYPSQKGTIIEKSGSKDRVQMQQGHKNIRTEEFQKSSQTQQKVHPQKSKKQHKHRKNKNVARDLAETNVFGNFKEDVAQDTDIPPEYEDDTPLKVTQKGREFFDENGELLFRI